jgi:hypothetical protein
MAGQTVDSCLPWFIADGEGRSGGQTGIFFIAGTVSTSSGIYRVSPRAPRSGVKGRMAGVRWFPALFRRGYVAVCVLRQTDNHGSESSPGRESLSGNLHQVSSKPAQGIPSGTPLHRHWIG